jgi:hypothetical protein
MRWMLIVGCFLMACGPDFDSAKELKCPDPIVEMAEYTTVVHSLDRCNWRLDEEQQDNFQMKDAVDHWDYISRLVDSAHPDVQCMLLIEQATRDFREQCEDEVYICEATRMDECWCPEDIHWR